MAKSEAKIKVFKIETGDQREIGLTRLPKGAALLNGSCAAMYTDENGGGVKIINLETKEVVLTVVAGDKREQVAISESEMVTVDCGGILPRKRRS